MIQYCSAPVLLWGKTHLELSRRYTETVCTGGVFPIRRVLLSPVFLGYRAARGFRHPLLRGAREVLSFRCCWWLVARACGWLTLGETAPCASDARVLGAIGNGCPGDHRETRDHAQPNASCCRVVVAANGPQKRPRRRRPPNVSVSFKRADRSRASVPE